VAKGVIVLHNGDELGADQLGRWEQEHGLVDSSLIRIDEGGRLIEIRHQERQLVTQEQFREGPTKGLDEMNWNALDEVGPATSMDRISKGTSEPSIAKPHQKLAL